MMTAADLSVLTLACEDYKVDIPTDVAEARATVAAADANLAAIKAEPEPDAAAAGNMSQVYDDTLRHLSKAGRVKTAEELLASVKGREEDAWRVHGSALLQAFRKPFDDAVTRFTTAAAALAGATTDYTVDPERAIQLGLAVEYQAYMAAADEMTRLARVRDALVSNYPDLGTSGEYEPVTRFAHLPTRNDAVRLLNRIGRTRFTPRWWRVLVDYPGVTVQWNLPQDQRPWLSLPRGE